VGQLRYTSKALTGGLQWLAAIPRRIKQSRIKDRLSIQGQPKGLPAVLDCSPGRLIM
jgi:hypothetical protein